MERSLNKRVYAGCGAAIWNTHNALLLIQRLREPEAGHWGLPGGKIDFGETAQTATIREIQEELGITIHLTQLACIAEIIDRGDSAHWVSPIYEAKIISGIPSLQEPEKHGGFGWFLRDKMPKNLTIPTLQYLDQSVKSA